MDGQTRAETKVHDEMERVCAVNIRRMLTLILVNCKPLRLGLELCPLVAERLERHTLYLTILPLFQLATLPCHIALAGAQTGISKTCVSVD